MTADFTRADFGPQVAPSGEVALVPGLEEAQAILTGLQAALKGKQVTSVAQLFLPNRPGDMKIARAAGKLDHLPPLLLPRAPTL